MLHKHYVHEDCGPDGQKCTWDICNCVREHVIAQALVLSEEQEPASGVRKTRRRLAERQFINVEIQAVAWSDSTPLRQALPKDVDATLD